MEWKKQVLTIGVAAAAVFAMSSVAASADETAAGGCNKDGHNGQGWTHYSEGGVHTKVTWFEYKISGKGTGGKSNVNIRHYEKRRLQKDKLLYSNDSPDNVKQNTDYSHTPKNPIQLDSSKKQHTDYHFVFDTAGSDPTCKATTSDFPA
ncbi:hypothetical protein [Kibdelosporangium phytohabitans]|uniref:Uncharacterized protein n=1 Tax=Kibdelosporangium phytohabitans TaxID=860235 RepID=A0A0N9I6W4_9PSEU|nr:hypothetical protein [Kibdelosporangium phytohabitans]ALG13918.1 hypothetical protein AOZ06_49900 [Kibdelosporangium phytohabitans]MBE1467145.1 hypothetical protein [Kibdelosporangium phytohabitans]